MVVYEHEGTHKAVYVYMGSPCVRAHSCLPLIPKQIQGR